MGEAIVCLVLEELSQGASSYWYAAPSQGDTTCSPKPESEVWLPLCRLDSAVPTTKRHSLGEL